MRTRCKDAGGVVHFVPMLYTYTALTACNRNLYWEDTAEQMMGGRPLPEDIATHTEERIDCIRCIALMR